MIGERLHLKMLEHPAFAAALVRNWAPNPAYVPVSLFCVNQTQNGAGLDFWIFHCVFKEVARDRWTTFNISLAKNEILGVGVVFHNEKPPSNFRANFRWTAP